MTDADLRALLDAATPSKPGSRWHTNHGHVWWTGEAWRVLCDVPESLAQRHVAAARHEPDARLIAAAPDLAAEVLRLRAENARLREALTFYADRDGTGYSIDMRDYGLGMDVGPIIKDGGEIARAALGDAP
jgi:hypothetical protein